MWREEVLIDKTIIGMRIKDSSLWLQVQEGGWIQIDVEGDCCSEAFIDAVRLNGKPKLNGASVEITFSAQPTVQEVDQVTAVRLDGDGGSVSILHRNSSNGYYGNMVSFNSWGEPPSDAIDVDEWFREIRKEN
jgi:hypothetical protein